MPTASTLWWIGVGAATALTATGGVLVYRQRKKQKIVELAISEGLLQGLGSGSRPSRTTPTPTPSRTTPSGELVTIGKDKSGVIRALSDGPALVIGDPYEGKTRLRATRYVFSLFELPRAVGSFEINVCVSLDYDFSQEQQVPTDFGESPDHPWFTYARILKWENGKRVRLFREPHIELYENGRVLGDFNRTGKLANVENYASSWLTCGGLTRFPTEPAFMYLAREGSQPTLVSWDAFTWDGNLPEGSGSDKYRPRWKVFVEDGWLKLRIWVSPMPRLRHTRPGQASVEAVEVPYRFAYDAKLTYQT